ncbi:MAG: TonB-dependent receptor [Candidatus Pseudobacter hemicellulosilyticus]|uniref:TonB-dependent receptor n=1 Tax=Candidatus Pseudobacter hemicellulosilyticus TaxID=3121375 RepID=A0AAJ5WXH5_9BACT|nr:MAG: TonB-dependent receptor [Pseudobacter sp.]
MRRIPQFVFLFTAALAFSGAATAQSAVADTLPRVADLQEVVVTGQYQPQSLRRSVYQVRTISGERIRLQGATNLTGVLNNELGIRFSNDRTLGTTDIELMGMAGRNVKILLDGVPLIDRGDTRESLNQVDVSSIERIEIVEGPMSVSYGSDALAGVINIITRKSQQGQLAVTARLQEESAGSEYQPLLNKGLHNQHLGLSWQKKGWSLALGGTHNDFGGWKESRDTNLAKQEWHPKEQWMGNARLGYANSNFKAWYRLDLLDETILNNGPVFSNNTTPDQKFFSTRYLHQVQADWQLSDRWQLNGLAAFTDYSRRTQTTLVELNTGRKTLSTGAGEQDKASFTSLTARFTAQYKVTEYLSLQPGIDINREEATGQRILGQPAIGDYAFFVSGEWQPIPGIHIRPGLRFIHNSVYDAPPAIPSINTKFDLGKNLDLRLAYARGFRAPALRELYFYFFDASHAIKGNPNLKAEYSNSFNGSLSWQQTTASKVRLQSTLGAFYNEFSNLINYGYDAASPDTTTYINIDRFKTTGATLTSTIGWKDWQATLGFSYIGRYNRLTDESAFDKDNLPAYTWSPELNANLLYHLQKTNTQFSIFYKFTGKRPVYQTSTNTAGETVAMLAETASFHWADLTISQGLNKYLRLNGGVKNLFNVTTLNNTVESGGAHSTAGVAPLSYGRSWFIGLNFQWNK